LFPQGAGISHNSCSFFVVLGVFRQISKICSLLYSFFHENQSAKGNKSPAILEKRPIKLPRSRLSANIPDTKGNKFP